LTAGPENNHNGNDDDDDVGEKRVPAAARARAVNEIRPYEALTSRKGCFPVDYRPSVLLTRIINLSPTHNDYRDKIY
jgi:hypothetical protein